MPKLYFYSLGLFFSSVVWAQSDIPVGTWRTHNAYNKTIALTANNEEIIAATNAAIYTYNPTHGTSEQITRLSGLSDAGITALGYNEKNELIIVSYANGNIDLISKTKIRNFRDLLLADIADSKKVNHIHCYESLAYLSTDFGVMLIDLDRNEVKDSYFGLGVDGSTIAIYSSTILNDTLYLSTEEGIIGGNLQDNLKDFNRWRRYGPADGMPQAPARSITRSGGELIAAFDNFGLYEYSSSNWQTTNLLPDNTFVSGFGNDNGHLLVTDSAMYEYVSGVITMIESELITSPKAALYFNNNVVAGDFFNGMVFPGDETFYYPNGPLSNDIFRLFGFEDRIVAIPPAYDASFTPIENASGFYIFDKGEWQNYNSSGLVGTNLIPEFPNVTDAMYTYRTKSLYLSSFGYGILEMKNEEFRIFDDTNSSLLGTGAPGKTVYVSALDANSSNLSALNFSTSRPYHTLDLVNDNWQSYAVSFPANQAVQVRGFENQTSWLRTKGNGILVYDPVNQRQLVINDNYLPAAEVNDMVIDREGKMWVATNAGIVYFFDAEFILDQSFIDPVQPIYEGQILFRNEKITALAVDGGNRIWMATTSGVWLFAEDGLELIHNFNAENSPLPSNNVRSITINHRSGEVFFATDAGLVSYRGTATIAPVADPVKIFPNPVLLDRHDVVTIQGVPNEADFWITDSSGRLVYKSRANGNTATWSALAGNTSLSSGVYFVFIASEDGEKQIGKIAIVN